MSIELSPLLMLIAVFLFSVYVLMFKVHNNEQRDTVSKSNEDSDSNQDLYNELVRVVSQKAYNSYIMHQSDKLTAALSTDNDYSFLYNTMYIGMYDNDYTENIIKLLNDFAVNLEGIVRDRAFALIFSVLSHNFKYVSDNRDEVFELLDKVGYNEYYNKIFETYMDYMPVKNVCQCSDTDTDTDFDQTSDAEIQVMPPLDPESTYHPLTMDDISLILGT